MINMTYNLGLYVERYMEKEYDDYEFNFIYDYVELFLKYNQSYINGIIQKINDMEKIIDEILLNISSSPIRNETKEYLKNNNICFDYYDLYIFLSIENKQNNIKNEYLNDIINVTFLKCFNEFEMDNQTNISIVNNYSLFEKITYIQNINQECFNYLVNISIMEEGKNISYTKPIQLLDCLNHNFYNYTNNLIEEVDNIFKKITNKVESNYIDDKFLDVFLQNYNLQLNPYKDIILNDINYTFEGIENMINYANYLKNSDFKEFLYNELILSFNYSYINLMNNFLVDDLTEEVASLINNKLELYILYMTQKIKDEYNYYCLILENTEEMGYSSKMAFINLYENIKNKINDSLYYLIENDIYFYLDTFYRENKILFINNFINYYVYNLNQYNMTIHKLSEFYKEIIIQREFNKTLDDISKELLIKKLLYNIKGIISKSINNIKFKIYTIMDDIIINITKILDSKQTKILLNDMTIINELIINYTKVVNIQNNRFLFKVSEKSFKIIYDFIHSDLKPPLILIKNHYNTIEEKLLNELIRIINGFPNYVGILKNEVKLHIIHNNISSHIEKVNELFLNYSNILLKEYESYINKLIHYTYINGLYFYDKPCNDSFCFINLENENKERILEQVQFFKKNFTNININRGKIKKRRTIKIRKLDEYNHTMGAISQSDIESFLLDLKDILIYFQKLYLKDEYKNINKNANVFFNKINGTFIRRLYKSIHMVDIKFSTILTKNFYETFVNNIYKQYNDIENYIYNNSDIIEIKKNNFIDLLIDPSNFIEKLFNISYNRIIKYYLAFEYLIQNQMKYISEKEFKEYELNKLRILSKKKDVQNYEDFDEIYKEVKNNAGNFFMYMSRIENNLDGNEMFNFDLIFLKI